MIERRTLLLALGAVAAWPRLAMAQQRTMPRIGILRPGSAPDPLVEAFRQGLRQLGYVEGRNIALEYRWAEGRDERLPGLAEDLVRAKVDLIVAGGAVTGTAAMRATSTIPIVMPVSTGPVESGLVASLARPGGNVTGFATLGEALPGKWIQLMKETLPRLSRVAVLQNPPQDPNGIQVKASESAARASGLHLQVLKAERPEDIDVALAEAQKGRAEALIVLSSGFFFANRTRIVNLAAKQRLPAMYHQKEFVLGPGGLMSYGADFGDLFRRSAGYVDKILKGAKPGDLPVEQPTKFELVINMKTARALGVKIPQSVLGRADMVIE